LAKQVINDFGPAWGISAHVVFVPKGKKPAAGTWQLVILDDSDQAGALGYHDLTKEGLPLGKVFARTDLVNKLSWSVTISHELLEMLGDPDINLTAFDQSSNTAGMLYAYEACDACEADEYGYQIDGIQALDILPGGYIGVFDVTRGSGWQQKTNQNDKLAILRARRQPRGSRRERRKVPRDQWVRSDAS
jgi:hypothetical protein